MSGHGGRLRATMAPLERIEQAILPIRGERVMLDKDLAALYGVETKVLNQAVRRNRERFPADFMFQLTWEEARAHRLRSQTVTLKRGQHRKHPPLAFTEQGVAMLSGVLRSRRAVAVNITIMRVFVRLRRMLGSNAELSRKLEGLEKKYDAQLRAVFDAIRALTERVRPASGEKRRIGFRALDQVHRG